MPKHDKKGPLGHGQKTGRGLGLCKDQNTSNRNQDGFGYHRERRFRNKCFTRKSSFKKQDLQNYLNHLEDELKKAKDALKNISNFNNKE